ncbi:MAG TPA: hypothetical protein VGQ13_04155 [Nitrososphaera sp.]|nr:hypothetical protein [Nitrososphaera sp.]
MSQAKLFTFNVSAFHLDPSVENFLRSKRAISVESGVTAYINSEAMPSILSELIERNSIDTSSNANLVAQLKAEVDRYSAETQKVMEKNVKLTSQNHSYSLETAMLKEQNVGAARLIDALKVENAHLQTVLPPQSDYKLKLSYEKLQKEFQELMGAECRGIDVAQDS